MAISDEIRNMQAEGKSDQEIILALQQEGYGVKESSDAIAQTKIKDAISASGQDENTQIIGSYNAQGMQQSMITEQPAIQEVPQEGQEQQYPYQQYEQQYQAYGSATSDADSISDIAEQVVAEKLASLRKQLENAVSLKSTTEAKIAAIDERVKRLEKVIDRLQLSILQKVGEYMQNVEDIKKEMTETQKSFKSLLNKSGKN